MPALRNLSPVRLLSGLLAVVSLLLPGRSGAEPAAPSLAQQLARAQEKQDHPAILEICRRELEKPGADAPGLLRLLFEEQLRTEDFPRATETLTRLAALQPPPLPATLAEMRGNLWQAQDKPLDEVLAAWHGALAAGPADPVGLQGRIADALDSAGRWEEAADAFRAALKLAPNHPARQARLAVCLLNAGRSAEADKEIQAAVRADAADDTVKAVAPLFDRLRPQLPVLKKLEARLAAGAVSNSRPGSVAPGANSLESASLDRALLLYRAGAQAGAKNDAARAFHGSGDQSLAARLLLAQCVWQAGGEGSERESSKEEEATNEAQAAGEQGAATLGVAKLADKDWFNDAARLNRLRTADQAIQTDAAEPAARAHTVRATVMLEADQPVLALAEARRAHEIAEASHLRLDDTEVVFAVACLRNDLAEEGFAAARRATEYAPQNPDGWAIWGRLEQETRADFAAAAGHLSKAITLREDPRWLRRRETCLRTLGRTAEADRDAQRAAQLTPAS